MHLVWLVNYTPEREINWIIQHQKFFILGAKAISGIVDSWIWFWVKLSNGSSSKGNEAQVRGAGKRYSKKPKKIGYEYGEGTAIFFIYIL